MKLNFLIQVTCLCLIVSFSKAQDSHPQTVRVSIDATATYQPILGWGIPIFTEELERVGPLVQPKMLDLFVNHTGCNAFRYEIERRDWEDYKNDNDDPYKINWDAFKTEKCDERAHLVTLPMKKMVEARGEKFWLYSSSSFFMESEGGFVPEWMLQSPAEFSEWLIAHLLYVKSKYGITIDQICVANEPDNHNRFTAENIGKIIKTLGPRLKKEGLSTGIMFPEHATVNGALDFIERWKDDPTVMDYVTCLGYHLYFETSFHSTEKREIYKIAKEHNIPTGQTEFMYVSFSTLYDDMINGGVSFWYMYWDTDYLTLNRSKTSFSLKPTYWDIRQVLKYVKQGSYRTNAIVNDPTASSRVLAFKKDGKVVVVCNNEKSNEKLNFNVSELPEGEYAVNKGKTEVGIQKIGKNGLLTVSLEKGEVATIYPTEGNNQPPLVTEWNANPSYMQTPEQSTTLSVLVSDQEKDNITYQWFVKNQPAGANVTIENGASAVAKANGLSIAGAYEFAVTINDGKNKIIQELVPVKVVSTNQAPVIFDKEIRRSVYPQLPANTGTRLGCAIYDPEGDPFTVLWEVVSQPKGANAVLASPTSTPCSVNNLLVPGEYLFRITATDANNSSTDSIRVTVHDKNNAPVINSLTAGSANLNSSVGETVLSATTEDADGEFLGHWWKIRKKPLASNPVFSTPGLKTTKVSGLSVPGTYVFTFTAADNISRVSDDITIIVK
jgi:O-glycosyl hydrolase